MWSADTFSRCRLRASGKRLEVQGVRPRPSSGELPSLPSLPSPSPSARGSAGWPRRGEGLPCPASAQGPTRVPSCLTPSLGRFSGLLSPRPSTCAGGTPPRAARRPLLELSPGGLPLPPGVTRLLRRASQPSKGRPSPLLLCVPIHLISAISSMPVMSQAPCRGSREGKTQASPSRSPQRRDTGK